MSSSIQGEQNSTGKKTLYYILITIFLVVSSVLFTFAVMESGYFEPPAEDMNEVKVEYLIHEKVNEERTQRGLEPLSFDTDLREIARGYSKRMATDGFFGHYDPAGNNFEDRYAAHDYDCSVKFNATHNYKGGENLAQSFYDQPVNTTTGVRTEYKQLDSLAQGIVDGWMNSPEHRENILTPAWRAEGIGVYVNETNGVYVTQNFC